MNELYQQNVIKESHCHFQEIDLFSSFYGGISSDPIRGIRNLHQLFPAAVLQQELIRESVSGRQAYNIYLGKHNVGQNVKITQGPIPLPKPNTVNHFGLSNSSWYKKACVPLIFSGVIVNFIEIALEIFQRISKMVLRCDQSVVVFTTVVLDQKAISPGACLYQESLFGISPAITVEDAENISKDGYKKMLENLIQMFKDGHLSWIKQGEVFLLHLLDDMVAFPIAIYHLEKSGDYNDVKSRVTEVLKYVSACTACLESAKRSGLAPVCNAFCKDCFLNKAICHIHVGIYDTWNCDERPCESCIGRIRTGEDITCTRARILLSISDQESAYEKFGKEISTSVESFRDGDGPLQFPFYHIHDIGHQVKNAQASLERGTHFDGRHSYDSTDLSLLLSSAKDDVVERMLKGVSHKAISQLDKHSDEQSLQRVSESVINACGEVEKLVRTDIPELRRPWFAEDHSGISSPLFLVISKAGVVYYTDDSNQSLSCYRQTPLPRKLIPISKGSAQVNDQGVPDDDVPFAPESVPSEKGKWVSISGLALTNGEQDLLVCDSKLCSIRIVKNVARIVRHPSYKTSVSTLKVLGQSQQFQPFSIRSGLPNKEQVLVTNPVAGKIYLCALSDDYTSITICRTIESPELSHPIDCLYFADNVIVVTDCLSTDELSGEVKVVIIEDSGVKEAFKFGAAHGVAFPFGLCEMDGEIYFSDHLKHCIFKINFSEQSAAVILGHLNDPDQTDGPSNSAKLCFPAGVAARGACLYVAEHPSEFQGAIRMASSLKGLVQFQSTWHDIAESMGLVSERARSSDPLHASSVRNKTLVDSLPDIITAADKLKSIITDIRTFTGAVSLDITNGSMASRTAEGFYVTLVNGVQYLSDYFKYTGKENLLNEIKVKTLGTRMIEGFYGHVTEKNPGNNPTVLQFSKRVATEAFHFVIPAVTSDNTMCQNVSVRRTRDEVSSTYTYAAVGSDDNETSSDAMWAMFQQRHEHCFTTEDLRKVKTNLENGKDIDPALLRKQLYIGRMAFCRGYVSMLGCKGNLTDDQKAKLRGIHMATKSRPMKTLRDFQKRKYGTPPTIIGQHATRRPLNATPIQDSIFTPSTTPQEDAVAVAAVHDQDDVSSYVNSNAFEVGEVVAFSWN